MVAPSGDEFGTADGSLLYIDQQPFFKHPVYGVSPFVIHFDDIEYMDLVSNILMQYGYAGMFVAAFIAGSVFPFSSEAVMAGLQLAGLEPISLLIWGTAGNVAGSMFNYWVGTFGRMEWIEKYLHVKKEKVEKTRRWMEEKGAWMGVLCFLPILGSVIAVTLGFMRANPLVSFIAIFVGKLIRYALLIYTITLI